MNKIWFKKIKDTQAFKNIPDQFKPFVRGGYAGNHIPVSKEGRIVTTVCVSIIIMAMLFALTNGLSKVANFLIISAPLLVLIFIAKIKS